MPEDIQLLSEEELTKDQDKYLYAKKYTCKVCDKTFENMTIRQGKNPLVTQDTDLRPIYKFFDSGFYDVVYCPSCGYTALTRYFNQITEKQAEELKKGLTDKHVPQTFPTVLNAEQAMRRYKMAIITALLKHAKHSEQSFVYLKTAWMYRSLGNHANEKNFLLEAYKGFLEAYANESPPICGMDEFAFCYLLADLGRRFGDFSRASTFLVRVLQSRTVSKDLKNKAENVRDLIREAKALYEQQTGKKAE